MKIVYNIIKSLRPHFHSLREIQDNISLDLRLPVEWKYEGMLEPKKDVPFVIKLQDKKLINIMVSLISPATVEGYEFVFNYAKAIIKTNIEEEEKLKLFNEKMGELKTLFLNSPLDKLKDISFNGKTELSDPESNGKIKLGDEEGPGADGQG